MTENATNSSTANVEIDYIGEDTLQLAFSGDWRLQNSLPSMAELESSLLNASINKMTFDSKSISHWDSGLLIFLCQLTDFAKQHHVATDPSGLPSGVQRLLQLAAAVPAKQDIRHPDRTGGILASIGQSTINLARGLPETLAFAGEVVLSMGRMLRGKAQFRAPDLFLMIQEVGPQALGIVSLISFLVGLILAYMGAVQLTQFGAQIFIADLVGIGMVREIAALMTGVIMAGRTGAAFAAQLGTMQVNEEIDAFKTLGISPMDFLVLPRLLALIVMMPLLTLYAALVGILGGLTVAMLVFDISAFEYYYQTLRALDLRQFAIGISKGTVYGVLVAFAGCLRGLQCGRSAQAVGQATTSAVVTSILLIVIAASILTIMFQQMGI
ncbi:MAG: ABC transporter permease [Gammaproteobacteria bacterium]|jgi:phospholipid/cholesterol/gamma-HCH transport system permease protein